ncbi:enhanced serine sensitivity protein SseB C-terminal domain-containing protein [Idiomarina xiamenensis]|uniref:Enhanced serine sensitivity protein SseB n=1 Tax=Idiomarina xiamenensis 10-D-4 TaxID=740709 RepID=K2KDC9_9GAMM|nr:enhanced serine sensitivity protein SseB C-terminal domain-containing protein [Idiomarina xiamenensis]EKE84697.1 enhanced serine sensitivity protein SseB [Idiomarina xiamenensis 10-D-4]
MQPTDNNLLEQALRLAAEEQAHRPRFIELLLDAEVLVLGLSVADSDVGAGQQVQIQHWQKNDDSKIIPFFTSITALQRAINEKTNYLQLPARALFEMTQGANLVLNPYSDHGKEFTAEEISGLLTNGGKVVAQQRRISKDTPVMLGQPASYPTKLVDSLTQLFAQYSQVKKAYLAMMYQGQSGADAAPNLVIGLQVESDLEIVISAAGSVVRDVAEDGEAVDFCAVETDDNSTLSQYFINQTTPFYQRRWGSKLKSWLAKGRA